MKDGKLGYDTVFAKMTLSFNVAEGKKKERTAVFTFSDLYDVYRISNHFKSTWPEIIKAIEEERKNA